MLAIFESSGYESGPSGDTAGAVGKFGNRALTLPGCYGAETASQGTTESGPRDEPATRVGGACARGIG